MTAIKVELQLADGTFTSGMLRAGQTVRDFQAQLVRTSPELQKIAANGGNVIRSIQQMDSGAKSFLGTLRDMSIVVGVVSAGISKMVGAANGWAGEIVRVNSEMERLTYQMRAMSTKADPFADANKSVQYLRQQATQMPFSLKAITNSFTKLKATGIDPTDGALKAIADGIAAFGGTDEQLNRVTIALTQMSGKGVIQMEELRQQLGEHMPTAMRLMARSMGISVAELTKEISTGTVAAGSALEKFYAELERTYGGSAQRMMQTFSGQVAQLKTNLQNLATGDGGATMFAAVKSQLADVNQFLQSDMAKTIATDLGNSIATFIQMLRDGIGWIWQFRDALGDVAILAGSGLGLLVLGRAVQSFGGMVVTAARGLEMFKINMREAVSNISLGLTGFRSLSTSAIGAKFAWMGAKQAFGALLAGFAEFGPLAILVGTGVIALADHFGLLSNKIEDAYDSLEKYGAATRAEAQKIQDDYIRQLQDQIKALQDSRWMSSNQDWTDEKIKEATEKLKKARESYDDINKRSAQREDAESMERLRRRLSDEEETIRANRATAQQKRDDQFKEDLGKLDTLHKSKKQLEDEYRNDIIAEDNRASEARIKIWKDEIDRISTIRESGDEDARRKADQQLTYLREKVNSEQQKIFANDASRFGVDKLSSPDGGAKAVERGEKALERLNRDIAGLGAKLQGANDAIAEMNQRIAAGDFGSIEEGGEAVQQLHDKLVAATEAKEILDKLTKGEKKAEDELNRLRENALEKQMDLKLRLAGGDKMTATEKFIFKLNNGGFDGLGNSVDLIRASIDDVIKSMNLQGTAANQLGIVLRENTFGDQSVQKVNTVYEAVHRLTMEINNLGNGLNGLSFQNFNALAGGIGNAVMGGLQPVFQDLPEKVTDRMKQAMTYLMQKGWSKEAASGIVGNLVGESGMNPNAIGDHGNAFGLAQWNDRGPAMKAFLAAQGKQWNDFFGQLDFIDHELRSSEGKAGAQLGLAKDAKSAAEIFMRMYERPSAKSMMESGGKRAGAAEQAYNLGPGAGVPTAATTSTAALPTYSSVEIEEALNGLYKERVDRTKELVTEAQKVVKVEKENQATQGELNKKTWLDELIAKTKNAGTDLEDLGKNFKQLSDAVSAGKLNPKNTDVNSDEYKDLVKAAKELDRVEQEIAEKKKAGKAADRESKDLERERAEINRRIAEEAKKAADPNYKPDSTALQNLTTKFDEYIEHVKARYGEDTQAYRDAVAQKETVLQQQRLLEATSDKAAMVKKRQELQQSLMSESQARQYAMQQDLAQVDQWVERARQAGMSEVEITETAEAQKAAIRAKYAQQMDPLGKQMQEWGDLQGNLAKASTKWMDSLADGLTNLIMGTGDLRSVIQGILKDMVNMGLKYLMSQMFGGGQGKGGSKKGGVTARAMGGKGGSKKGAAAVGLFHTGGIIGSRAPMTRLASPAAFINAPKFHKGGIIGPKLTPGEVPIIAKRGEGVFTPEQMDMMGGMQTNQSIEINAPITVNGSAGTPDQNNDLAKKMAKEMEQTMRGVVADEVRKQSKPGNFLNSRSR